MRGFLTNLVERRMRRLAVGAGFGVVIGTTSVAGPGAPDPRFNQADLAAARAQILLTGACGVRGDSAPGACEKRLKKAIELLARVRATIAESGTP